MTDFIVHIGVNKTGTSSLQRAFFDARPALAAQGIVYPDVGIHIAAHHDLSRAMRGLSPAGVPDDWAAALAAACDGADLAVLSSEDFATAADPAPLAQVCPPGRTRIVVYVREHVAHTVSWYQQTVQSLNTAMTLAEFARHSVVNYCEIIDRWAAVFGAGNVVARTYDRAALDGGDVVTDFARLVRPGLESLFAGQPHDSNPSLSGNLLFLKRLVNLFVADAEAPAIVFETGAMARIYPQFRGRLAVDAATVALIRARSEADRRRLAERHGIRLKPPSGAIPGDPSPDLPRLAADLATIRHRAVKRGMALAGHLAKLELLAATDLPPPAQAPASPPDERTTPMTDDSTETATIERDLVADVARAMFLSRNPEMPQDARKAGWQEQRAAFMREARALVKRLEQGGYTIAKS